MNPPEQPINEADYVVPVPLIQNDKLHNVPNIDFFNLCFSKSNETYGSGGKYGVSRELYAKFMRNQKPRPIFTTSAATAAFRLTKRASSPKPRYSTNTALPISKPQYGRLSVLCPDENQDKGGSVAAIASTITDFMI